MSDTPSTEAPHRIRSASRLATTGMRRVLRQLRRRRAAKRGARKWQTRLLIVSLLLLGGGFAWALNFLAPQPQGGRISLDQLLGLAEDGRIIDATFLDEDSMLTGSFSCSIPKKGAAAHAAACPMGTKASDTADYWVPYPKSDLATGTLLQTVTKAGARVGVDPQTPKAQVRMVTTFLAPLMILANLFALLFTIGRTGSSGIGEVVLFGSFRRGRIRRGRRRAPVTFADVGGADEAVTELREVVDYLRAPERYEQIGALPPKGVLMIGPPGCGKTLLAKAAAGEARVPFFSVAGAEFVESLVGVGAARVRDLFQRVRAAAPAIVFIDELDAAGRRRGSGSGGGGSDEREQTLNQLLVDMDGFEASSGIVVIGATNRPDILDPALLRPGRFDRHITVDQPDREGRRAILALHATARILAADVELGVVARRTPGFSGADLANVINEAALLAVRAGKPAIETADLFEAVERVLAGPQRRGRMLSADERRRTAVHEAGHAIVAAGLDGGASVHRVSILSRGRTLGTSHRESDERVLARSALRARLVEALGGLAAEELMLGEPSTGSESDLERATRVARDLIARYGMSDELGRARLLGPDHEALLQGDAPFAKLSEETQRLVDAEIRKLLADAEEAARLILQANEKPLTQLVARLESEEMLEGDDLARSLAPVKPATIRLEETGGNGRAAKARARRR